MYPYSAMMTGCKPSSRDAFMNPQARLRRYVIVYGPWGSRVAVAPGVGVAAAVVEAGGEGVAGSSAVGVAVAGPGDRLPAVRSTNGRETVQWLMTRIDLEICKIERAARSDLRPQQL